MTIPLFMFLPGSCQVDVGMATQPAPLRQPAVFIAHGGGPLPLLGDPAHARLTRWLTGFAATLPQRPSAILMVSAHWEVPACSLPCLGITRKQDRSTCNIRT